MNQRNFGIAEGRLTADPTIFPNKDGSKKVKVKVAVRDNYKNSKGEYGTQFLQFDGFIKKDATSDGVYAAIHQGDLVGIQYEPRTNNYEDPKTKEQVYGQVLLIQAIDLKESKSVTDARQADRAATAAAGSPVADGTPAADTAEDKPFNA